VTFDGSEYVVLRALARGAPLAIVYPVEGTPLIISHAAVMKDAPHPNAARLFINFLFSREGRQFLVDNGQQCCLDPDVTEPAGRMPLSQVKLLTADPEEQETAANESNESMPSFSADSGAALESVQPRLAARTNH
jgi:iron(III) transport system substrate-binding protein